MPRPGNRRKRLPRTADELYAVLPRHLADPDPRQWVYHGADSADHWLSYLAYLAGRRYRDAVAEWADGQKIDQQMAFEAAGPAAARIARWVLDQG